MLYQPLESTPLTFVETLEDLKMMANILDTQTAIAVDLEACIYTQYISSADF